MSTEAAEPEATEFDISDPVLDEMVAKAFGEVEPEPAPANEPAPPSDDALEPEKKPDKKAEKTKAQETEDAPDLSVDDFTAEDSEDDAPEDVKAQGEKAVETWGTLKREKRELKGEVATLKAEIEKLKANPAKPAGSPDVSAEIEELRTQLADARRHAAFSEVTQTDEYKREIVEPFARLEQTARDMAGDGEEEERILAAISEQNPKVRDAKLEEITEGMSEYKRAKLLRIVDSLDELKDRRRELLANAEKAKADLDRQRLVSEREAKEKEKEATAGTADRVLKNIKKNLPFLTDEEGEFLPEFSSLEEAAITGLSGDTPLPKRVFADYAANLVPMLSKHIAAQKKQIDDLNQTVKAMTGASPKVRRQTETPAFDMSDPDKAIEDLIANAFG